MHKHKESSDRKLNQLTTGYWINPDGKVIPIYDHFEYLLEHPEEFGIKENEIEGISFTDKEKRVEFLLRAVRNNWIRVRRTGGVSSVECWELSDWTLARIQMFCKKTNVWDTEYIRINELAKKSSYPIRVKDLVGKKAMQLISSKKVKIFLRDERKTNDR